MQDSSVCRNTNLPLAFLCCLRDGKREANKKEEQGCFSFFSSGKSQERRTYFHLFENETVSKSLITLEKVVTAAKKPQKINPKCPTFRHSKCCMERTERKKVLLKKNPLVLGERHQCARLTFDLSNGDITNISVYKSVVFCRFFLWWQG